MIETSDLMKEIRNLGLEIRIHFYTYISNLLNSVGQSANLHL